ncbi:hypothetical protein IM543_13940 [Massilia sp. UMI-21]|nr:hypothetical protein IM543_13940 [Massilia sp. UMI-21]
MLIRSGGPDDGTRPASDVEQGAMTIGDFFSCTDSNWDILSRCIESAFE